MSASESSPATTVYRGRRDGHEYEIRARHPFLEARAELVIDGVLHEPVRERSRTSEPSQDDEDADGITVTMQEGFSSATYQVRRPDEEGELHDAERIVVRTAWRGAGEVDVTDALGLDAQPLRPEPGSASAAREERRAAHPLRFALVAAGGRAAGFLLPLLGIGALLSGVLRPVRRWVAEVTAPVREALAPVGEAISAVREALFGWIPDISLPAFGLSLPDLPDLPGWVGDVLVPAVVVLGAGAAAWHGVRRRARRLEQAGEDEQSPDDGSSSPMR
ncbi:hypothetical protein [Brachybacterium phenoliresistens]|uniref:hypothetical protein n=1 Tax=Brachybacterium phenoliresistens TaxID=396014 RepID=UPI0031D925CF